MTSLRVFPSALEASMPCNGPPQGIRVIDVGGRCNERRGNPAQTSAFENQTSYWNEAEAVRVVSLLNDIIRSDQVQSVGIISPYSSQVSLIKTMVAADQKLLQLISKLKRPLSIEVNSVDGYQGRERDVIIVSTVRSNRQGRIGFLEDWRRMNVAMTRAKCGLFVVGDLATLAEGDTYWAAFVQYANRIGVVINTK
jgi:ATP-dependent RNA/DNA helicase IGHMBP2